MNPNQLIATVTATAAALAEGRSSVEITLMGALFTQLGDTLTTIAAQRDLCESRAALKEGR